MLLNERRKFIIFGALFGAWLSGVYAYISQAVNWIALPGIPVGMLSGSFSGYLVQYILVGAVIGLVCALPENRFVGMILGGVTSAVLGAVMTLFPEWGFDSFGSTFIAVVATFMPLVVLFMPLALVIRLGVDAQQVDPSRPNLWARRYLIPLLLTLLAAGLSLLALYPQPVRSGFRQMQQIVQQGMSAPGKSNLPAPLRDVNGFTENARGAYTLAYTDRTETFNAPVPAGSEMSQFLIITRYENGFSFACIFSSNRSVPTCTNY